MRKVAPPGKGVLNRGAGRADAVRVTDLTAYNSDAEAISVDICWLPRGKNNSSQTPVTETGTL